MAPPLAWTTEGKLIATPNIVTASLRVIKVSFRVIVASVTTASFCLAHASREREHNGWDRNKLTLPKASALWHTLTRLSNMKDSSKTYTVAKGKKARNMTRIGLQSI